MPISAEIASSLQLASVSARMTRDSPRPFPIALCRSVLPQILSGLCRTCAFWLILCKRVPGGGQCIDAKGRTDE